MKNSIEIGQQRHTLKFSIKEGICGSVPMIVMPFFAEQAHNVKSFALINTYSYQLELF